MAEVDNKVVSITFDNASFQRKMSETIVSLDKLRQSIDMAGAKQGLTELSKASKNFDMAPMGAAVEGVSAKFLALSTVGITALATLVHGAVTAGAQFVKSLTLGPVTQGFGEFELKMGSIQTIMSGSGESLEVVNKKLQELNDYSDKTIYSFKDMTESIGKFTNAGVNLDDAVGSIQGVANVAALSGANAEEASRAMFNFAQALSTGSVKLIDWVSIEKANMGTVEFKQQLIDSAEAMGTLTKAGDHWVTSSGKTVTATKGFRENLAEGWLTSEALTKTLTRFADTTTDIGARATAAASDVKTFSQMLSTMKESVGSGWSTSFEHVFGNFEEGKKLWTNINTSFNKVVGSIADARNLMLKTWNDFGSRTEFIKSLADILKHIGKIIKPIGYAFRQIFPKKTGEDLIIWTYKFGEFTDKLKLGGETIRKIITFFRGFFAIIDIGFEVVKGLARVFFTLAKGIWKVISPIIGLISQSGALGSGLHDVLVKGKGIEKFFDALITVLDAVFTVMGKAVGVFISFIIELNIFRKVANFLDGPVEMLKKAASAIKDFFGSLNIGKGASKGVEETGEALDKTAGFFDRLLEALKNVFGQIGHFLGSIGKAIAGAFKGLGGAIADALGSGNFSQVLNILKVGMLGGILVYIRKFFKKGLKFDFGQGKLFESIQDTFKQLTSTLKSLQTQIRAKTLMTIALAMGILTLSIIALSLIDAAALTKALVAITVGFTQMTLVMVALEKMSDGGGALKITAMAAGMVLMAAAMALLVIPIKVLSTMDMGELAKGLGAVSVGMLVMAAAVKVMGSGNAGVFRAAAAMILISVALIVLASAIKKFSEMDLSEMGFGLAQAALGIGLLILALKHMPDDVAAKGIGLLILALALRSLAKVVQLFAGISFGVLAKGFIAISVGLELIALSMSTFPDDMVAKAAALIIISGALFIMGKVIEQVGKIKLGDLAKGVGALSAMLAVLAIAIIAMEGAEGGVLGLIAAAGGLWILGKVVKEVGAMPFGDLLKGIGGLILLLAALAVASLAAPGLVLLGVALLAIGAGLALIGAGVALAGKGLELMAKYGGKAIGYFVKTLQAFIREIPGFVSAFVVGLIEAAKETADAFPELIESIKKVLITLIDAFIEIIPKLKKALTEMINNGLDVIIKLTPKFVDAGFAMLQGWLTGFSDNIGEIVILVAKIVTNFLDAFTDEIPGMIDSLVILLATLFQEVAFGLGELMPKLTIGVGRAFLEGFWQGLNEELGRIEELIMGIVGDIIGWFTSGFGIFSPSKVMADIGKNIIQGLINGIKGLFGLLKTIFIEIPIKVLKWIGNMEITLVKKGISLLKGLLTGIIDKAKDVIQWFKELPRKVIDWLGNIADKLIDKGKELIGGILTGVKKGVSDIWNWFMKLPEKIWNFFKDAAKWLYNAGKNVIKGLWEGIKSMKNWLMDKAKDVGGWVTNPVGKALELFSPSKVFMRMGINVGKGLIVGIDNMKGPITKTASNMATNVNKAFSNALEQATTLVGNMDEFQPTIAPVLDLAKVRAEAKNLDKLMNVSSIRADVSIDRANAISVANTNQNGSETTPVSSEPTEIKFEQNIYSPKALSVADVYRGTKSQIALAKEELKIA